MSTHSHFDRESFQTLLANAFAVQQSGMDTQSLSPLVEVQRVLASGELDAQQAMQRVSECARHVANATGAAIALLEADELVYRAGSGTAAAYVGRHVAAVLNISSRNQARREILRVENAQVDTRIEAAVCRQFGVGALLMLPVLRKHAVAGVLEVLFNEAHTFDDREVTAYRLMAGLVEDLVFQHIGLHQERARATPAILQPQALESGQIQQPANTIAPEVANRPRMGRAPGAAVTLAQKLRGFHLPAIAAIVRRPVTRAFDEKLRWKLAAAAVVVALVLASWIGNSRRAVSPAKGSPLRNSNAALQTPSRPQIPRRKTEHTKSATSAFKRVRIGPNEVDYVAEDVTIKRFISDHGLWQIRAKDRQVNIGDDVTVHYFAYKPAAAQSVDTLRVK